MYLKSLTLRGFKSFASTTTLNFEPGITCVVGPNGSGKSNIIDALSWVMGEQGAKTLRGGKMEDVIFAGTSKRAPLGRAEVLLTIDNSDGALPIEYAEVTISRTMFRSGGSEYAINGTVTRLLDVQELLSDSGIGQQMHVIVGQGQLDAILHATPETRRGFIEEAAGVTKHRKRKEKAQRKLESTAANLNRLSDLLNELRRQLKPLGRQAEATKKAASIQSDVFDAKARLLADDYSQALAGLQNELAAEASINSQRAQIEEAISAVAAAETDLEMTASQAMHALTASRDAWYTLAGIKERATATAAIAAERLRAVDVGQINANSGRDPQAIADEITSISKAGAELDAEAGQKAEALQAAVAARQLADHAFETAEKTFQGAQRAFADQREGLARLAGEVNTLRSRAESTDAEIERLNAAATAATQRADTAKSEFAKLETSLASLTAGESGLDFEYSQAENQLNLITVELAELQSEEQQLEASRAGLAARLDALKLGLDGKDGQAALLATAESYQGVLGSVAALIQVPSGDEVAISAALGLAADAVVFAGMDNALAAMSKLKAQELGRAGMLLGGLKAHTDMQRWPELPKEARYAATVVKAKPEVLTALERLLYKVALVRDIEAARKLVADLPDLTAVTPEGDVLSSWLAVGGSATKPSLIQLHAAIEDATDKLAQVQADIERLQFELARKKTEHDAASQRLEAALARLNESDAEYAALAEQASSLNQSIGSATAESSRMAEAIKTALESKTAALNALEQLEDRLDAATAATGSVVVDSGERDRNADLAAIALSTEMDARLALRTVEERARALHARVENLELAAAAQHKALAEAQAMKQRLQAEATKAKAVSVATEWLHRQIESSIELAEINRVNAQVSHDEAQAALAAARLQHKELAKQFEDAVATAHRDELSRTQQQMKLDLLVEKAASELSYDPDALLAEFGPEVLVPIPSDENPEQTKPYVRHEQERRLAAAQRELAVLGKVNPLALEEFEAMQERHAFLADQLEDLRKTRADLLAIIEDVEGEILDVFQKAFEDVRREFKLSFERLFPGGEGNLVLTEPGLWLTTGVEVEARPAGKKVKRLSLLSGGERALVAIAFLVSLFKARPSPFYILDEVEAALDDVNLELLLKIFDELRTVSQLLVITHQKRTMEIADSLYGVAMRDDGVTTVISQRLREE
ncbi:MAG: chromosome segregation protein SMC [Propionibacteriaceae bacterium]|nr:chromosome segregation protein SMC [Propionibacteriaceae bacterium]